MSEPAQGHWEWLAGGIAGLLGILATVKGALNFEWPSHRREARDEYRAKIDQMESDMERIAAALEALAKSQELQAKATERLTDTIERLEDRSIAHQDKVIDTMQRFAGRLGDVGSQLEAVKGALQN